MALDRVSFSKPVTPMPRHSAPYVPGRKSDRWWSEKELQILRDHFEQKGAQFCRGKLPRRSTQAIYLAARKLGLKGVLKNEHRRTVHRNDPELDARILEEWPKLSGKLRGEVTGLADRLNVPRWWLSKRALALGLAIPRFRKEPNWSAAEIDLLKRIPLSNVEVAARVFRDHGFSRTPASIMNKAKRLAVSRRYSETLSATAAAKILGVDGKTFTLWIAKGFLKATKRETRRLPQQGGHPWSIDRGDFRQFIIKHLEQIDFRKVDKFALVDILTMGLGGPGGL